MIIAAAPMDPPAPARFSETTGWPQYSETFCITVRPTMSVELPAVKEMIACTGFVG